MGKDPNSINGNIVIAGILLMVAINILSGFTNVLVARDRKMIPPLVISSASMTIGGIGLFLFSIPFEGLHFECKACTLLHFPGLAQSFVGHCHIHLDHPFKKTRHKGFRSESLEIPDPIIRCHH